MVTLLVFSYGDIHKLTPLIHNTNIHQKKKHCSKCIKKKLKKNYIVVLINLLWKYLTSLLVILQKFRFIFSVSTNKKFFSIYTPKNFALVYLIRICFSSTNK